MSHAGRDEDALRRQAKDVLRRQMRALRSVLPQAARAARSAAITERVTELAELQTADVVAAFMPMRREVDVTGIICAARESGKRIALPRIDPTGGELLLHFHDSGDALVEGVWGIAEPAASAPGAPPAEVDFVLVPALAVDERGHRVGYGKGFYDRLLPRLTRAVSCVVVFDFQLIAEVPERPGDHRVDLVVTDQRVLRCPDAS